MFGLSVDSDCLALQPFLGFGVNTGNEEVDLVPDFGFHLESVSFGGSLQFEDDSSGFGVNLGFGFSNEVLGSDLEGDLEVIFEFLEFLIPFVLFISNSDSPVLA